MKTLWLSIKKSSKERSSSPEDLTGNYNFTRGNFCRNAKSLVKHLLVADLSKRYGNLKRGVQDIKKHRWFKNLDWEALVEKRIPVPYKPIVK